MVSNNIFSTEKGKRKLKDTPLGGIAVFIFSFLLLFFAIGNILIHTTLLQSVTAHISNFVLNFLGMNSIVNGIIICTEYLHVSIDSDCTFFLESILFISILIAFPIEYGIRKRYIILLSLPILFSVSILRIVSIVFIGFKWGVKYFDLMHLYVWPITVILFPAILLFVFAKIFGRKV